MITEINTNSAGRPEIAGQGGRLMCTGASVRGTSHIQRRLPCQDAHHITEFSDNWALGAVADGAGSAPLSHISSGYAVKTATSLMEQMLQSQVPDSQESWEAFFHYVFKQVATGIQHIAAHRGVTVRLFHTTLGCFVFTPEWCAGAQVGDGILIAQDALGELRVIIRPEQGEFANQTVFLTNSAALEHLRVTFVKEPLQSIGAITDGMIPLLVKLNNYQPGKAVANLFHVLGKSASAQNFHRLLQDMLASERVNNRTDDDKTVVLATIRSPLFQRDLEPVFFPPHNNPLFDNSSVQSDTVQSANSEQQSDVDFPNAIEPTTDLLQRVKRIFEGIVRKRGEN